MHRFFDLGWQKSVISGPSKCSGQAPREIFYSMLTFRRSERCRREIHAETLTPHGHGAILREIDARRQIIVLVTDVALDAAEINEARFGDRVVVFSVGSGHQVNTHVGTVGGFEAAEAQHLL